MPFLASIIVVVLLILASAIRILREYERGVIFRLGRLIGAKGPGLIILIPFIDKMVKTSLRTVVMDVPPQDVIKPSFPVVGFFRNALNARPSAKRKNKS
jgi:regulator of protease activity HflC (stomatin/prohibitin superfamily)